MTDIDSKLVSFLKCGQLDEFRYVLRSNKCFATFSICVSCRQEVRQKIGDLTYSLVYIGSGDLEYTQ